MTDPLGAPLTTKPQIIIFDWDNTLVDSFPLLLAAYNHLFQKFDMPEWDEETARENIRLTAKDTFPEMFGEDRYDEVMEVFHSYIRQRHLQQLSVLPGAKALLQALKAHDISTAIVSNKTSILLLAEIEDLQWGDLSQIHLGACDVSKGKPDPEGILKAATFIGMHPQDCCYVGDTENDMLTAQAAGMTSIYVRNDQMSSQESIERVGPDYCFNTTQELLETLLQSV